MQYNFGVTVDKEFNDFKNYMEKDKLKEKENKEKKEINNSILKKLAKKKDNNKSNLKSDAISSNKCINILKKFCYLSFHNLILILIITLSMLISGFISIIYITISLYFLLTSTKMYLGEHYYYPRAIKVLFRIMILIDILLQIIYQIPLIHSKKEEDIETKVYQILGYIGLNKILSFKEDKEGNLEVIIGGEEMALVLAKVVLYLLMSFQLLIYSSRNFIEYYLAYLITKKYNLKKASLMNVFKFNNKRIEEMNTAIKLRQDMAKKMENLKKDLDKWLGKEKEQAKENIINVEEKENKDLNIPKNKLKAKSERLIKKEEEEEPLKDGKSISERIKNVNTLKNPYEKILTEKEVVDRIKSWLLSGFLIKFQLGIHKLVANYNTISEKEKYLYELDIIQGKCIAPSYIEKFIEEELASIDKSNITENDMKELKSFYDRLQRKKKEKSKKKINKLN
jgi:hypothetical protein